MGLGRVWKMGSFVVVIWDLWDFAPLWFLLVLMI